MGGRGSGGSRSSGGASTSKNLSKQIDSISKKVYSNDDFAQNYSFYNNLSDDDLIQAEKLVKRKFETANKKYNDYELKQSNALFLTPKEVDGGIDTNSKEYRQYIDAKQKMENIAPKVQNLEVSWKIAKRVKNNRGLK